MKAHLIDTHLLVPRSRSSAKVKVKYQGHVSQEMGVSGALVFHKVDFLSVKGPIYLMILHYNYDDLPCLMHHRDALALYQTTKF